MTKIPGLTSGRVLGLGFLKQLSRPPMTPLMPIGLRPTIVGGAQIISNLRNFSSPPKLNFKHGSFQSTKYGGRNSNLGGFPFRVNGSPFGPGFGSRGAGIFSPTFALFRVVGGIVLFTALLVFVAAPILFIVLPIVFVGAAVMLRFRIKANRSKLAQQAAKLANTSLRYKTQTNIIEDIKFQRFVNSRIRIFIEDGEQENRMLDSIRNINDVSLAEVYSRIYQNWIVSEQGEDLLVVLSTELNNAGSRFADVVITLREIEEGSFELIIELANKRQKYLINSDSQWSYGADNDKIIDLKEYDVRDL